MDHRWEETEVEAELCSGGQNLDTGTAVEKWPQTFKAGHDTHADLQTDNTVLVGQTMNIFKTDLHFDPIYTLHTLCLYTDLIEESKIQNNTC